MQCVPPKPGYLASCRIHIIDDDRNASAVLSRVLRLAGFKQVQVSTDPEAGIREFERETPDLLFLDLHMPGMDGFDVLKRLVPSSRLDFPPVPVVMLTGDGDATVRCRALSLGATDFLLKPFDSTEVVLRTRALLEMRGLHRELAEQNRLLEARVAERSRELEASQVEMLHRLAAATELHDDETGQHTQRVGSLAGRLARAMGLPVERAELIARAAPLHDIGKIGVSDAILRKPGRLTPEEFEAMKAHASIGGRVLAGGRSELIRTAERIARHHHERWDGDGYADGLAGTAIPLEARIVAVADFFDALTHDRPYRHAFTTDRALTMIREGSGSHFDPDVAATFLQMLSFSTVPDALPQVALHGRIQHDRRAAHG